MTQRRPHTASSKTQRRDLLCKLHATIQCTPDGLFLSLPDVKAAHAFQFLKTIADCLYCWSLTDFNMASSFTVSSIQKIAQISPACATQMSAMRPVLQCHCTAAFNPPEVYKQLADVFLNTQEGLECEQCLFVGPQGCAIPIRLSDAQRKLVNDKDSFPYITVAVSPGCDPQQLESMVAQCQALRGAAQTPQTQTITHLGLELYMLSLTEHIQLPQSRFVLQQPPLPTQYGPPSELSEVPSILWAKHKNHVGFVNSAPPHEVTLKPGAKLPMVRQYNLPHKSIAGIEGVIQSLLDQGVLVQTTSPCNTPILPIPKANRPDEWRFVQDLQAINSIVVPTAPIVPDTNSILASLPSNSTHYTVIDLSSAFFSIPLHPDSQYLFAFTFKGKQYTWQRLPQGFVESPTVYAAAVKRDLDDLHFPGGSTLLQYADDLLIASPSQEACRTDSILLLQRLAECGHRASLAKLQFCRSEVTYLGHVLKNGQRLLSPERLKLLVNMPPPTTKKQMLSFLGMANYCRHWIFEYAAMDSVLRNATLQSAPPKVQWTEDMNKAFQDLKHALTLAPALGLPDYHQPFHLHVHERDGFATGKQQQLWCAIDKLKSDVAKISIKCALRSASGRAQRSGFMEIWPGAPEPQLDNWTTCGGKKKRMKEGNSKYSGSETPMEPEPPVPAAIKQSWPDLRAGRAPRCHRQIKLSGFTWRRCGGSDALQHHGSPRLGPRLQLRGVLDSHQVSCMAELKLAVHDALGPCQCIDLAQSVVLMPALKSKKKEAEQQITPSAPMETSQPPPYSPQQEAVRVKQCPLVEREAKAEGEITARFTLNWDTQDLPARNESSRVSAASSLCEEERGSVRVDDAYETYRQTTRFLEDELDTDKARTAYLDAYVRGLSSHHQEELTQWKVKWREKDAEQYYMRSLKEQKNA
ncbi:uncharacterized protein LOC122981967 [Thunnus albacares]|uniref:uncharacterized protein LOC122981967 n=1 Tax=Thunnus albacares TaxID=8236 RepID=UPI001CF62F7E|nr:uncharacterized protein LOC122981967 [Thunnus albacares]